MMNIKSFLKLVEIRTKVASMIPFIAGSLFAAYHFENFDTVSFLLMFGSLFIFDMTTTAFNNYFDYKRARVKEGYNYEEHNAIGRDRLSLFTVRTTIAVMLSLAIILGILLVFRTNLLVLLIGVISFAIGILYSFGPVPISSTPFGEAMSGFFMGFIIVFLSIYIHLADADIFALHISNWVLDFRMNFWWLLMIILFSVPHMACIANIMLANNICDMEEDIKNKRFTLPNYIGKKNALILYGSLYGTAFISIVISVITMALPVICLIGLLAVIPVYRNVEMFMKVQTKKDTFVFAVKNYFIISISQILLLTVELIVK